MAALAFESPCSVPIDTGGPSCDGALANVTDLDAADFDRDGHLEVVAALPRGGIEMLRGVVEACATLAAPCIEAGVVSTAPTGALVSLGDFTGDGNPRLLTVGDGSASLLAADGEALRHVADLRPVTEAAERGPADPHLSTGERHHAEQGADQGGLA